MNSFLLDANALVKRYASEVGTAVVDHLFANAARERLMCLMLGAAEVAAALARKRNGGAITVAAYSAAMTQLRSELIDVADFVKLPAGNAVVNASIPLLDKYAINATDALVLCLTLDVAAFLRGRGDDLVLVTSDHRLLNAAQTEGLLTFDPESGTEASMDVLLKS